MIPLAQSDPLALFVLVALGLTIAILMLRAHRYLARQRGDDHALVVPPRPKPEPAARLMDGPPELARWEVEMHQTTRDLSAELNSRVSVLRAMVGEADRAAARLESALRKAADVEAGSPGSKERGPSDEQPPVSSDVSPEAVYTLADYGFSRADIAARLHRPQAEIERLLNAR